ncbi:hypothetical protein ANCDUO_01944 [Ancylostoma duodenale]|uniref:Uncharacterized protein n=1 Tax=Ancylostoma duodenale TaxID=51022 RepID=A0A0C2H1S8_9BILA|nr:hypothetical protein ANCDUO_01944 [Ancylostoma duodenale]
METNKESNRVDVLMEEIENEEPVSRDFPYEKLITELERVESELRRVPIIVRDLTQQHKVSARYKEMHEKFVSEEMGKVCDRLRDLGSRFRTTQMLEAEITGTVRERDIETSDEWHEYVETMERDGAIIARLCQLLNVNPLQVTSAVKESMKAAENKEEKPEGGLSKGNDKSKEWKVRTKLYNQNRSVQADQEKDFYSRGGQTKPSEVEGVLKTEVKRDGSTVLKQDIGPESAQGSSLG